MRRAFTLAEVLITIGIIGVVSAITIPVVINKYRAKVLETQFKKSYSTMLQAFEKTKTDLEVENVADVFAVYNGTTYELAPEFENTFDKNLKVIKKIQNFYPFENYNGTATATFNLGRDFPDCRKILSDGSSYNTNINSSKINIFIDINGPYKRPNRYGHDIFMFEARQNDNVVRPVKMTKEYTEDELKDVRYPHIAGAPCNLTSKQQANGMGCSYYAVNNICPYDNSKKYWDCLPR